VLSLGRCGCSLYLIIQFTRKLIFQPEWLVTRPASLRLILDSPKVELIELGLAAASDEHSSAFLGETLSGAEANAGAAASYDCYFVFEFLFINLSM
jgi:hypothetical protein